MKHSAVLLMLIALLAGCSVTPPPAPVVSVASPAPTWTAQPTLTPNPTYTPYPTPAVPPTVAPTPTTAATAAPAAITHVVKTGDTLNGLSKLYKVSAADILAANNLKNPDVLPLGQTLTIPVSTTGAITAPVAAATTLATAAAQPVARPVQPAQPVQPKPAAPPAPSGVVFPAPRILRPLNGAHYIFKANEQGGTDDVTFEWLPVGTLESGAQPCSWPTQPNGTTARIWDRYQIEFDPPLYSKLGRAFPVFHNDQGMNRTFSLLEFKPDVVYKWRVGVGRWCVSNYDVYSDKHEIFMQIVSGYTPWYTFSYTQ